MSAEIDKTVINIVKMADEKSDVYFWKSQSYASRLEALEEIRSEYINWKYGAEPEFQRVYRVTKLK